MPDGLLLQTLAHQQPSRSQITSPIHPSIQFRHQSDPTSSNPTRIRYKWGHNWSSSACGASAVPQQRCLNHLRFHSLSIPLPISPESRKPTPPKFRTTLHQKMQTQNLPKTLNPPLAPALSSSSSKFLILPCKSFTPINPSSTRPAKPLKIHSQILTQQIFKQNATCRPDLRSFAGRSKGNPGGTSSGRLEGGAELRREAKRKARQKSSKYADSFFYRLKNPHKNYPDNFSEEELQMIGLGYDRFVRFMEKDDPNLKHPYDWYKYGEFGPYSWRGLVLGEPIRGRFTDERATMIGCVRDQREWEKIEQFEMSQQFQSKLDRLDKEVGLRYFWVFVRHPRWSVSDLPWQQWTLVSEVVLEAGKQRLDKWSLMGRLGNKARAMVTQCASWFRPDILYVKKPVYQCRFEPQDDFFRALTPLLDPETEQNHLCELQHDDGRVEMCTYFGGLCKLVRVNQKAFVDDVTRAFQKLSDDKKSKCLEFLLNNHPVPLLHPYTKEWKAKLEEMELGCDASDDESDHVDGEGEGEVLDWIEDEGDGDGEIEGTYIDDEEDDDGVLDAPEAGDDVLGIKEDEDSNSEEDPDYWNEQLKKAMTNNEDMEKFATHYIKESSKLYEKQIKAMEEGGKETTKEEADDELAMRKTRAKVSQEEWKRLGYGPFRRKVKKSKVPPGLFLGAAVRPFTYRNLIKEIVLTRHAILEGE